MPLQLRGQRTSVWLCLFTSLWSDCILWCFIWWLFSFRCKITICVKSEGKNRQLTTFQLPVDEFAFLLFIWFVNYMSATCVPDLPHMIAVWKKTAENCFTKTFWFGLSREKGWILYKKYLNLVGRLPWSWASMKGEAFPWGFIHPHWRSVLNCTARQAVDHIMC